MIEVSPLRPAARARWEVLSRGYKTFYETELPDVKYEETWRRLMGGDGVYGYADKVAQHAGFIRYDYRLRAS